MDKLQFDKNRRIAKYCPCNKSNRDGKFVPYKGFVDKGFCHSCGNTFFPDKEQTVNILYVNDENPKSISFHDKSLVEKSMKNYHNNNFALFLLDLFDPPAVFEVLKKYQVGTCNFYRGGTIFWQIDEQQYVRHGKVILYNKNSGKKVKLHSVKSILKREDFNLKQCLYGLHLLSGVKEKAIGLVESEKTAILMSLFRPEYIWMATGGLSEFKIDKLRPLKPYTVVVFPDKGKFTNWQEKAMEFNKFGYNFILNDLLENKNVPEETDLADILIELKKS